MQETIYDKVIGAVSKGSSFKVDFKSRTLKVDGKDISLDGEPGIPTFDNLDLWLDEVEDRYDTYKYSLPSEKSSKKSKRRYFKALDFEELVNELGDIALMTQTDRLVSQAELEVFILLSLINGQLDTEELFRKDWYYQGADKSFVLLKDWF